MNENRFRKIVTWIVAVIAVVIVSGIGFAFWASFSDGPLPDVSDLMPNRIPIPDSENGFLVLRGITPAAKWDWDLVTTDRSATKKWDQKKVDAALAPTAPDFDLLDKAMAMPRFQFEKITSFPGSFPYLPPLQNLGRFKALSALNHWKQGEQHTAVEESLQIMEFGRRIENGDGDLIHFLIGISVESMAARNFLRFASDASSAQEKELKSAILRLGQYDDHTAAFSAAMRIDFVTWNIVIDDISSGKIKTWDVVFGSFGSSSPKLPLPFQPNNTRSMLAETYRQIIREAPLPYDKTDKEPGMMKTLLAKSTTDRLLSTNAAGRILYTEATPVITSVASKKCRATTIVRLTRAFLAVRCYWLDHGTLPTTLDDLVPAYLDSVPLDPYDGKPLRYSPANKLIYSVGKEAVDHGGDSSENNSEGDRQPTVKIDW